MPFVSDMLDEHFHNSQLQAEEYVNVEQTTVNTLTTDIDINLFKRHHKAI